MSAWGKSWGTAWGTAWGKNQSSFAVVDTHDSAGKLLSLRRISKSRNSQDEKKKRPAPNARAPQHTAASTSELCEISELIKSWVAVDPFEDDEDAILMLLS